MPGEEDRLARGLGEGLRWTASAVIAALAHALIALVLLTRPEEAIPDAGAPVVLLELAPVFAAPRAPPSEAAAGPPQAQSISADEEARPAPPPEPPMIEPEQIPEVPPPTPPEVVLPTKVPEPSVEPQEERAERHIADEVPVPTAPPPAPSEAPQAAGPLVGHIQGPTAEAMASWQRLLTVQLERHKRYPRQAQGQHGVTLIAFVIDRAGHVMSRRIQQSSGSAILDDEALALIERAQPFPAPPAGISEDELTRIVAIRFVSPLR
jgi:protein TonB